MAHVRPYYKTLENFAQDMISSEKRATREMAVLLPMSSYGPFRVVLVSGWEQPGRDQA
jgi:hypothetical protein